MRLLKEAIEGKLPGDPGGRLGFVHPSTLAQGCLLAVAHELLGHPRAEPEARRRRIMQVGSAAHERIMEYLKPFLLAREVPFLEPEYRIRGRCDALLFIPPTLSEEHAGFYVLEVKTASSIGFAEVKGAGAPKVEHRRQCLIYQRGLRSFYGLPIRGGIIYYENRDTLEYALFPVQGGEDDLEELLGRLRRVIQLAEQGELPEGPEYRLPDDHWAHRYCPYLPLCPHGRAAVENHRGEMSDALKAKIIAESIVRKQAARKERRRPKSLEELARELGWE